MMEQKVVLELTVEDLVVVLLSISSNCLSALIAFLCPCDAAFVNHSLAFVND